MKKSLNKIQKISTWMMKKSVSKKASACNLCGGKYTPSGPFQRFCLSCRSESEVYRAAEWLPVCPVYT
jgi:hypothetical protein